MSFGFNFGAPSQGTTQQSGLNFGGTTQTQPTSTGIGFGNLGGNTTTSTPTQQTTQTTQQQIDFRTPFEQLPQSLKEQFENFEKTKYEHKKLLKEVIENKPTSKNLAIIKDELKKLERVRDQYNLTYTYSEICQYFICFQKRSWIS
jgi:hypothetical protein